MAAVAVHKFLPRCQPPRSCFYNMRMVGFALRNYHEEHGHFPPAYIADKSGKPLLSWRVLLLPFMEYGHIYEGLNLTLPWDAPRTIRSLRLSSGSINVRAIPLVTRHLIPRT